MAFTFNIMLTCPIWSQEKIIKYFLGPEYSNLMYWRKKFGDDTFDISFQIQDSIEGVTFILVTSQNTFAKSAIVKRVTSKLYEAVSVIQQRGNDFEAAIQTRFEGVKTECTYVQGVCTSMNKTPENQTADAMPSTFSETDFPALS